MTTNVLNELGNKWLPLDVELFFTEQRAPDMWFADELPPTAQAELRSPLVTQSRLMMRYSLQQQLVRIEQRAFALREQRRRRSAIAKVGGRKRD